MNGWKCPKCGTVWAPFIDRCYNCFTPNYVIKYTSDTKCNHAWEDDNSSANTETCKLCGAKRSK